MFPRALHTTHQQIEIIIIMLSLHGSLTHGLTDVCFPADLIQQEPPFVAAIVVRREFEPFVAIQDYERRVRGGTLVAAAGGPEAKTSHQSISKV